MSYLHPLVPFSSRRAGPEPPGLVAYSPAELAACYGFGLAKNHAMFDGNKRLGFLAIGVFLR